MSPEILPGRQWAFSHRYFRRKKNVYRYSKTTLSSQILGTLDFALLVCCVRGSNRTILIHQQDGLIGTRPLPGLADPSAHSRGAKRKEQNKKPKNRPLVSKQISLFHSFLWVQRKRNRARATCCCGTFAQPKATSGTVTKAGAGGLSGSSQGVPGVFVGGVAPVQAPSGEIVGSEGWGQGGWIIGPASGNRLSSPSLCAREGAAFLAAAG